MDQNVKIIRSASSELFLEAIKTLPVVPKDGSITFLANGVYIPDNSSLRKDPKYIAECESKGIIPYSSITIDKYDESGLEFAQSFNSIFGGDSASKEQKAVFLEGLLKGGRPHDITIELKSEYRVVNFKNFRTNLLDKLVQNGYQISSAYFTLSSHEETSYREGDPNSCTDIDEGEETMDIEDIELTLQINKPQGLEKFSPKNPQTIKKSWIGIMRLRKSTNHRRTSARFKSLLRMKNPWQNYNTKS
ncbi:MAG: hypothetical protein NTY99_02475 [DPANN group archaeon]|nr:hypothetical protein [DPANN group archaeon]